MSNYSLSDTLRSLATRLDSVQEVLGRTQTPSWPSLSSMNTTIPLPLASQESLVLKKLDTLTQQMEELKRTVAVLRGTSQNHSMLPINPMHGIEVVPKREVVLQEANELSVADRLLLNKDAKRALEAEEMGAIRNDEYPLGEEDVELNTKMDVEEEGADGADEDAEEAEEAEDAEDAEDAEEAEEAGAEEADEAEAEEAEELIEFEYKGNTFYRDSENNVFMPDEDGDIDAENPVGTWNAEKGKIVVKK